MGTLRRFRRRVLTDDALLDSKEFLQIANQCELLSLLTVVLYYLHEHPRLLVRLALLLPAHSPHARSHACHLEDQRLLHLSRSQHRRPNDLPPLSHQSQLASPPVKAPRLLRKWESLVLTRTMIA